MKNKSKWSILLIMVMVLSTFLSVGSISKASSLQGSGTEASPYLIYTVDDLYSISNNPAAHYKLMEDLDLGDNYQDAIAMFSGVFDGNGKTIKNLKINSQLSNYIGLFSRLSNARVKDLTISDAYIYSRAHNVGALAGQINGGTISNCYVEGGEIYSSGTSVGGLAGSIYDAHLYQCSSTANVDSLSSFIGGLVGQAGNTNKITQSYAIATVRGYNHIGGLTGFNTTKLIIEDSYSICDITSIGPDAYATGLSYSGAMHNISNSYSASTLLSPNKVGLGMASAINSYFDSGNAGITTPTSQSRSTADMYNKSNYVDWDFENVWTIKDGEDYPRLKFAVEREEVTEPVLKIVLEKDEQLQLGTRYELEEGEVVTWHTSNSSAVTVDANGIITAVGIGNATITVKSSDGVEQDKIHILVVASVN